MNRPAYPWLSQEEAAEELSISVKRLQRLENEFEPVGEVIPIGGERVGLRYRLDRLLSWNIRREAAMSGPNRKRQRAYRVNADRRVRVEGIVDDLLARKPCEDT